MTNAELDDILALIEDRDYEVRLLALEKLSNYFEKHPRASKNGSSSDTQLHRILLQRTFVGEENQNCYVLAVKLLMTLHPTSPYPLSESNLPFTIQQYWNKLMDNFTEKKPLSVKESVLPLLGALLKQVCHLEDKKWSQNCFITWSDHIVLFSQKEITLPLREATVKSINHACFFLFSNSEEYSDDICTARIATLISITQLLQDDDVDVRVDTADIVSKAMHLQTPVHHERALELVHRYLTSNFSGNSSLKTGLESVLNNQESLQSIWEDELSQSKALFAKENPNIYKEDLIDIQWAKVDLDTLYVKGEESIQYEQMESVCQQLIAFTKSVKSMSATFMQHGPYGITSSPNIFMAIYRAVSMLHTEIISLGFARPKTIPEGLIQSLKELSHQLDGLDQDWLHPLLWKMLYGNEGLCPEVGYILKYQEKCCSFKNMFLLAPDMRNV